MKTKLTLIIVFILIFSINSFTQVQITPNKVTYKRIGKNVPDHKRTFVVIYPVVLGMKNYEAEENLLKTLDYWNNFDGTLAGNLGDEHWLTDLYYRVNYNRNSILDITLTMEGVGAYPDESTKNLVIDLNTGKQIRIKDVFANLDGLAAQIDRARQRDLENLIKEADREAEGDGAYYRELMKKEGRFTPSQLKEFSISDRGVTFLYDYDFVHAAKALEPPGRYFFSWSELKPFIRTDGLLGQFVR